MTERTPRKRSPRKPARRSGGGTLLGIIIGLFVGAGVAIAAAWYFTRANPFQDLGVTAAPAEPASVRTLPGKPGGEPVARPDFEFYKVLPQPERTPGTSGAVQPARPPASAAAEQLYLQVGAFANPAEADNLKARLALAGLSAVAQRGEGANGQVLHRVRIGPFDSPEAMNPTRSRLAEGGFDATVVRVP